VHRALPHSAAASHEQPHAARRAAPCRSQRVCLRSLQRPEEEPPIPLEGGFERAPEHNARGLCAAWLPPRRPAAARIIRAMFKCPLQRALTAHAVRCGCRRGSSFPRPPVRCALPRSRATRRPAAPKGAPKSAHARRCRGKSSTRAKRAKPRSSRVLQTRCTSCAVFSKRACERASGARPRVLVSGRAPL
jgi:hypothetical protein